MARPPILAHDAAAVTAAELAAWLGVGERHIRTLASKGLVVRLAQGYDLRASVSRYIRHLSEVSRGRAGGGEADPKTRLDLAKARKAEAEAARLEGRMLPTAAVRAAWARAFGAVRQRLLALPRLAAPEAARAQTPDDAAAVLTALIHRTLEDLSREPVYDDAEPIPGLLAERDQGGNAEPGATA